MHKLAATLLITAAVSLTGSLGGCVNSQYTFPSTTTVPQSLKLVELSTNETVWSVDVPVGQSATIEFFENNDKANTARPDLMRWQLTGINGSSKLTNSLPVPPAWNRRLDSSIRKQGSEAMPAAEAVAR